MLELQQSYLRSDKIIESIQLLANASDLLASGKNYDATLDAIAKLLVSSLASWCTIDLVQDEGRIERVAAAHRNPAKNHLIQEVLKKYPPSPTAGRGVYKVIKTAKSILIPELTETDWKKRAESAEHLRLIIDLGSTSYMCVPLIVMGRVVGSIMLLSSERVYDERDLFTTESVAHKIAMAVDNVSMFRKMQATIEELQATQKQLIQSAKMSALGTVCAGIAHEVNNPLTVVRLNLENIENSLDAHDIHDQAIRNCIEKANRNVERIVQIVTNVQQFSRKSDLAQTEVDIAALIDSSLTLFEEQFRVQQIKVEKHFPAEPVFINADPSSLQQVFVNVISNARDAIIAKGEFGEGKIKIVFAQDNSSLHIEFFDNGVGLSNFVKERAFEPFFTTKDAGKGTGLGLSISHSIMARHKGEISFEPAEGDGARVHIRLPKP